MLGIARVEVSDHCIFLFWAPGFSGQIRSATTTKNSWFSFLKNARKEEHIKCEIWEMGWKGGCGWCLLRVWGWCDCAWWVKFLLQFFFSPLTPPFFKQSRSSDKTDTFPEGRASLLFFGCWDSLRQVEVDQRLQEVELLVICRFLCCSLLNLLDVFSQNGCIFSLHIQKLLPGLWNIDVVTRALFKLFLQVVDNFLLLFYLVFQVLRPLHRWHVSIQRNKSSKALSQIIELVNFFNCLDWREGWVNKNYAGNQLQHLRIKKTIRSSVWSRKIAAFIPEANYF